MAQTRTQESIAIQKSGLPLILVFGGPSAGKAALCKIIAQRLGYTHLSAGQLLREEAVLETVRGRRVRMNVEVGHLCEVADVHEIVREKIWENLGKKHLFYFLKHLLKNCGFIFRGKPFLIHGYPRDPQQRTAWETDFGKATLVIVLECPDVVLADRTAMRSKHGTRPEDKPEIVHKRIQYFVKYTKPMLRDLQMQQFVLRVDGNREIEQVYEHVRKLLEIHIK